MKEVVPCRVSPGTGLCVEGQYALPNSYLINSSIVEVCGVDLIVLALMLTHEVPIREKLIFSICLNNLRDEMLKTVEGRNVVESSN